jgi:septal ring factor EnvC (AmiA/AmiB activator)
MPSLLTGRVTVASLSPDAIALGVLAPGDSIIQVNGISVQSCEHAAELIKRAKSMRIRLSPGRSPLTATLGVDLADMCTAAQLTHKVVFCVIFCVLLLVAVPMMTKLFQVERSREHAEAIVKEHAAVIESTTATIQRQQQSTVALAAAINTVRQQRDRAEAGLSRSSKSLSDMAAERQKLELERKQKEAQLDETRATHDRWVSETRKYMAGVETQMVQLQRANSTLSRENEEAQASLKGAREQAAANSKRANEAVQLTRMVEQQSLQHEQRSLHHNRTVAYLRQRDAALKQKLEAATAVMSQLSAVIAEASATLDATPFPPPPPSQKVLHQQQGHEQGIQKQNRSPRPGWVKAEQPEVVHRGRRSAL